MLSSCGLIAARPCSNCHWPGFGLPGTPRSQRLPSSSVSRKAELSSGIYRKRLGRSFVLKKQDMGQIEASIQSDITAMGASTPDLADPFGGAMPKEDIGALRFLKVLYASISLVHDAS